MISDNLKRLRKSKGLSLRALAEKSGISKSTLSDIENSNVKSTTFNTLEKIAEALETPLERLTGESINCLIENKLEELGISLQDLAKKANLPLAYLESLDERIPHSGDYERIEVIAKALNMPVGPLRAALARQEPPSYEGPISTPEDDFDFEDLKDPVIKRSLRLDELEDEDILTLAAHRTGYEGSLSEEELDKIKLAIKIALAKNNKQEK